MNKIAENLSKVKESILQAEKEAGRKEGSVKLLAVSKFHPAQSVIDAIEGGQNFFGENRVQEAEAKFTELNEKGFSPELHIIGSLQRNKVKKAVSIASCIESVDRMELLDEIEKQCAKIEKSVSVFFEIHTGEESKSGFTSEDDLTQVLSAFCEGKYPHITADGFMTMAPNTKDETLVRKSFSTLRELSLKMKSQFLALPLRELSMGMSGDYKIAISEGSTIVRIGTAIFGERNYSA